MDCQPNQIRVRYLAVPLESFSAKGQTRRDIEVVSPEHMSGMFEIGREKI